MPKLQGFKTLTHLKACKMKMPMTTVKNPVRTPITSLAGRPFHSLKSMADDRITQAVKNT